MSREIPIFFSTDDHYIPYLDVAIALRYNTPKLRLVLERMRRKNF